MDSFSLMLATLNDYRDFLRNPFSNLHLPTVEHFEKLTLSHMNSLFESSIKSLFNTNCLTFYVKSFTIEKRYFFLITTIYLNDQFIQNTLHIHLGEYQVNQLDQAITKFFITQTLKRQTLLISDIPLHLNIGGVTTFSLSSTSFDNLIKTSHKSYFRSIFLNANRIIQQLLSVAPIGQIIKRDQFMNLCDGNTIKQVPPILCSHNIMIVDLIVDNYELIKSRNIDLSSNLIDAFSIITKYFQCVYTYEESIKQATTFAEITKAFAKLQIVCDNNTGTVPHIVNKVFRHIKKTLPQLIDNQSIFLATMTFFHPNTKSLDYFPTIVSNVYEKLLEKVERNELFQYQNYIEMDKVNDLGSWWKSHSFFFPSLFKICKWYIHIMIKSYDDFQQTVNEALHSINYCNGDLNTSKNLFIVRSNAHYFNDYLITSQSLNQEYLMNEEETVDNGDDNINYERKSFGYEQTTSESESSIEVTPNSKVIHKNIQDLEKTVDQVDPMAFNNNQMEEINEFNTLSDSSSQTSNNLDLIQDNDQENDQENDLFLSHTKQPFQLNNNTRSDREKDFEVDPMDEITQLFGGTNIGNDSNYNDSNYNDSNYNDSNDNGSNDNNSSDESSSDSLPNVFDLEDASSERNKLPKSPRPKDNEATPPRRVTRLATLKKVVVSPDVICIDSDDESNEGSNKERSKEISDENGNSNEINTRIDENGNSNETNPGIDDESSSESIVSVDSSDFIQIQPTHHNEDLSNKENAIQPKQQNLPTISTAPTLPDLSSITSLSTLLAHLPLTQISTQLTLPMFSVFSTYPLFSTRPQISAFPMSSTSFSFRQSNEQSISEMSIDGDDIKESNPQTETKGTDEDQ
ncbi:hypothetical protein QTN25_009550 [Entamoeba marina]